MEEKNKTSWIFAGVTSLVLAVVSVVILWYSIDVLLLFFAGILLAILLRSISIFFSHQLGLPDAAALGLVLSLIVGSFIVFVITLIPTIDAQWGELGTQLAEAWNKLKQNFQSNTFFKPLFFITKDVEWANLIPQSSNIFFNATNLFTSTLGIFVGFFAVFFIGIFLAGDPQTYKNGFLKLIPIKNRARIDQILDEITVSLQWWLIGKFLSMALIGVLTALGLWLLDIPLAVSLGLIAAVLTFIPNFGPILSAIPAVLMGAAQSLEAAFYVILLYAGIQIFETYLITPVIQQKTISLPPALIIGAQILLTVLAGGLGLILATPLIAVIIIIVNRLYVEDVLHDNKNLRCTERDFSI